MGGRHIVRRIEFVESKQVDDLAVHHVFSRHDRANLPVGITSQRREVQVESDFRLTDVTSHHHQCIDRHTRTVQFAVFKERFVKIAEIGIYRV